MAKNNSMSDAADESARQDLTFRRRDMLETEKVAGQPFGKLFFEETQSDGTKLEVATALGTLAMQYVVEKRNGLTDDTFDDWLDGEAGGFEVELESDPS